MIASAIDFSAHISSVDSGIRMLLLAVADCAQRDAALGESNAVRDDAMEWLTSDSAETYCECVGVLFGMILTPKMLLGNVAKLKALPPRVQVGGHPKLSDADRARNAIRMKQYQKDYQSQYQRASRRKEVAA